MSSAFNDVSAGVVCLPGLVPDSYTETTTGTAIDLVAGDGAGFAVLAVGSVAAGTEVGGYLEESDDGQTWAEDPIGTFPTVTAASTVRVVSFRRAGRYIRAVLTVEGSDPQTDAAVLVGQQRKQV